MLLIKWFYVMIEGRVQMCNSNVAYNNGHRQSQSNFFMKKMLFSIVNHSNKFLNTPQMQS